MEVNNILSPSLQQLLRSDMQVDSGRNKVNTNGVSVSSNLEAQAFSPIVSPTMKPLKQPPAGFFSEDNPAPDLQFSESATTKALDYEDRLVVENSVLAVEQKAR